jgi:hypothetical protein
VVGDCAALLLLTFLSAVPYVFRLGFYGDDWAILASFTRDGITDLSTIFPGRPFQAAYAVLLFELFGRSPLGYHLTNTAAIAAASLLFYLLLIRLRLFRAEAFAAAVVFALLPQLSTTRVWISAVQIPVSMILMLLSLHAQLTFARGGKTIHAVVAVAAAVLSVAAYEIFAPFIAAFPLGLFLAGRRDRRTTALALGMACLLLVVIAYKILASHRAPLPDSQHYLHGLQKLVARDYDWRTGAGLNIYAAAEVYVWLTIKGWLHAVMAIGSFRIIAVLAAAGVAALSAWRLSAEPADDRDRSARRGGMLLLGIAAFLVAHTIFLIVPSIVFAPTGIANRMLVGVAIGLAMILVGALSLALRGERHAFALVMSLVIFCAALRMEQIAEYWAEAPALQQRVIAAARHDLRNVPAGSTIIVDGVCPYHRPAIVFETSWDVAGALSLALDRPLNGDTVNPRMVVGAAGLTSSIYDAESRYPYSPRLFVYNPRLHVLAPLRDAAAARDYFKRPGRWPVACPPGYVGHGVAV